MSDVNDTLKQEAAQAGLTHLTDQHLSQLAKAKAAADRMVSRVPRDFAASDEPAHVYHASQEV